MNNSFLTYNSVTLQDIPVDLEAVKAREVKLIRVVEAIRKLQKSKEWSTLKTEVFDGLTESLNALILAESKKEQPDIGRLNKLSGQLLWAERFSDLAKFEQPFSQEIKNIKQSYGEKD